MKTMYDPFMPKSSMKSKNVRPSGAGKKKKKLRCATHTHSVILWIPSCGA